ncbi:hypothetical protein K505DRAFT_367681 [Melanomma pulvis-pyrius CBS 109.77]|uniref:Uncharacterized protein n=1 Tax=Melanomma pulvis-pyrius CBS 109.77 TaxID=1314802 RepID=A0A6A6WT64_9PLEO|nr:hypothetical protein K505DRAFT_367681 [Melanomma pulvis-pyrius CBS 109.77]
MAETTITIDHTFIGIREECFNDPDKIAGLLEDIKADLISNLSNLLSELLGQRKRFIFRFTVKLLDTSPTEVAPQAQAKRRGRPKKAQTARTSENEVSESIIRSTEVSDPRPASAGPSRPPPRARTQAPMPSPQTTQSPTRKRPGPRSPIPPPKRRKAAKAPRNVQDDGDSDQLAEDIPQSRLRQRLV